MHSQVEGDPQFTELGARSLGGISFTEAVVTRRSYLATHTHTGAFFSFTLAGRFTESDGRRRRENVPSSVVYHPPHDEHEVVIGERDAHYLNVSIEPTVVRELCGPEPPPLHTDGGPLLWLAARLVHELRHGDAACEAELELLVVEMLSHVAVRHAPDELRREPSWMRQVEAILAAGYASKLNLIELARRVDLHPVHLSRTWRRFRDRSIADELHRLRIEAACRRLVRGDVALSDLAVDVGFSDQPQFCRVFKRVTGITPGAFRDLFAA